MSRNIKFKKFTVDYLKEIARISFENYELERLKVNVLPDLSMDYFAEQIEALCETGIGYIALVNNDVVGFLIFDGIHVINDEGDKGATSPLYGYGVTGDNRGEVIGKLFQKTATELCEKYISSLRVNVYAHDEDVLNMFIMSSFAMNVTEVIRNTSLPIPTKELPEYTFKEMTKDQLLTHRDDVILLYRELINHLRRSPVFYHCKYFLPIEDRFEDFLSDEMRIFCVFYNDKLVGMIDSEPMNNRTEKSCRFGDISLNPNHRGLGVAKALLSYANDCVKKDGYTRIYVTHGTINPTARGFWDKYFANYSYTMTRVIDREMLGVIESV
ncbi:GNAT family N-acetyltransferase [Mycoplasmatota bacterium WC44]